MKDEWNAFVKANSDKSVHWWLEYYRQQLRRRGGLTAREWDHYDRFKKQAGVT